MEAGFAEAELEASQYLLVAFGCAVELGVRAVGGVGQLLLLHGVLVIRAGAELGDLELFVVIRALDFLAPAAATLGLPLRKFD